MVKRVFFLILIFLFIIPGIALAQPQLSDIEGHWANNEIQQLVSAGAISGYPDGTFRPDDNITRAEFVSVLFGALGLEEELGQSFEDVSGHWARGRIEALVKECIILPEIYGSRFGPDENITRKEIAVMTVRSLDTEFVGPEEQLSFTDANRIDKKYRNYVGRAYELGIITGYPDGRFGPDESATRAQAAVMVVRMLQKKEVYEETTAVEEISVHFIDVGQGDCIFIDGPGNYDILIDAGDNSQGEKVVRYLEELNTDDIEIMIATHNHADHIGGLDDVLEAFEVEKIIYSDKTHTSKTYKDFWMAAQSEGAELIEDDNLTFEIGENIRLYIFDPVDGEDDLNNSSVCALLDYDEVEALFTGDLESDYEDDLVRVAEGKLHKDIEIYKVGHHGSRTSSSEVLLNTIMPEVAIISCGENNKYGHPHEETLKKLAGGGAEIYRTDLSGSIVVTMNGTDYAVNKTPYEVTGSSPGEVLPEVGRPYELTVVIQEIDLHDEVVTIKNTGSSDVDMSGWVLVSEVGNQSYTFPYGYILKAGATVRVWSGRNAKDNPPADLKWTGSYIWNNDGDPGVLKDASGNVVSRYCN